MLPFQPKPFFSQLDWKTETQTDKCFNAPFIIMDSFEISEKKLTQPKLIENY